jgi:hypothetical protein
MIQNKTRVKEIKIPNSPMRNEQHAFPNYLWKSNGKQHPSHQDSP